MLSSDARQDRKGSALRDKRNKRAEIKAAGRVKSGKQMNRGERER